MIKSWFPPALLVATIVVIVVPWSPTLAIQIGLTLALAAAALYIVRSKKYAAEAEKWAYSTLGTLLGYWLVVA